ncbi:DUF5684 domain-containing protein [Schumannella luteola]
MDDYSQAALQVFLLVIIISFAVTAVLVVALYIVMAISLMGFFGKVGVERWIAWVPIYSTWKWLEVGGQNGAFALISLIPYGGLVTSVFLYIGMHRTGIAFGKDSGFLVLGIFLPFVWAFILGGKDEVYRPELITQAGYPPPRAGFGAVPMN